MADKSASNYVAIGDSLAVGMMSSNKLDGQGRVGAGPDEVLKMIREYGKTKGLSGKTVFLGTGLPNIPTQSGKISEQIRLIKESGGTPVLIGTGPGTEKRPTTGQNDILARLAKENNVPFTGSLESLYPGMRKADPMGLHLRPNQYKDLFQRYAPAAPKATQPQSRTPQVDLNALTATVMQAESQGKRYDKSGKLLTSKAGALGEMQVMPKTITDPGFGVKPAKDTSPDEIARVGRDYLATMVNRYGGDVDAALVAYNWGPGNADKWVKKGKDFGSLPKETQKYVTFIQGKLGGKPPQAIPERAKTPATQPQRQPSLKRAESTIEEGPTRNLSASPVMDRATMEQWGPNYQAALAVTTLGDSREDDDDESIAEKYMNERQNADREAEDEEYFSRPTALSTLDMTFQSPFEEEQAPLMLANGGEVGGTLEPELEPTFGQRMGAAVSDVAAKGLINVYDSARLLEGALSSKEGAAKKEKEMSAAHKIYLDTFGLRGKRGPVTKDDFNDAELQAISELIAKKGGQRGSIQYKDYGMKDRKIQQYPVTAGKLDPYVSVNKSLGQFNYELDPKTNTYRIIDEYDFNPLMDANNRPVDSDFLGDYLTEEGLYNKARIYGGRKMPPGTGRKVELSVPAPVRRAEGSPVYGEVATGGITPDTMAAFRNVQVPNAREALNALLKIGREGVSNLESVARGSVAGVPGVVGDVESIFRDDKARRFATSTEVERDYLPKRMSKPTKESAGFTEIGTAIDPTIVGKVARPTAKAALKALKESGPQIESALMKAAPAAQPMYAVRPDESKVGFTTEMGRLLVDYRNSVLNNTAMRSEKFYPLRDMVEKKAKDYYIKQFGTANDPLRKAVMQGELPLFSLSNIDQYAKFMKEGSGTGMASLIKAAKAGDKKAQASLEKIYDEMTGLTGFVTDAGSLEKVTKAERARMTAQQIPEELQNVNVRLGERKSYMGSDTGRAKLYNAEETNRPLYDMQGRTTIPFLQTDHVVAALSQLPEQKLKTLDFAQAVIEGTKLLNKRLAQEGKRSTSIYPKK
jgi:hypothetical protein